MSDQAPKELDDYQEAMNRRSNDHIPSDEVLKDIRDTEAEIAQMEREIEGFRLIGDRMSLFKADVRVTGIAERKVFIGKLNALLESRK